MLFPWKKRKQEHEDVSKKLARQEHIARQIEERVKRLEKETDVYRLRRRTQ